MMGPFQHSSAGTVTFGPGAAATVADKGPLKKAARVYVLTDAGVKAAGLLDAIVAALGARVAHVDDGCVPDADVEHIDQAAARAKEQGVDAILAVGGGSVMDTAKCVGAVLATGKGIASLEGIATIRTKLLPLVCVPTTAGTGSEATQFAVVKDRAAGKKRVLMDASLVPLSSVLDPLLTVGLPRGLTAATGVDALTHAVEALASRMANPVGRALALEAARILVAEQALSRALGDGSDVEARGACLIAAHLAGQAISTNMLGACHAFAHALGAVKGVPHGVANGIFLEPVMRLNQKKAQGAYALLGRTLGSAGSDEGCASFAVDEVARVVHEVAGIPRALGAVGVVAADVDALVVQTMADPDLPTNPAKVDEATARALIEARLEVRS